MSDSWAVHAYTRGVGRRAHHIVRLERGGTDIEVRLPDEEQRQALYRLLLELASEANLGRVTIAHARRLAEPLARVLGGGE